MVLYVNFQKGLDPFVFFIILNLRMPSNLFAIGKKKKCGGLPHVTLLSLSSLSPSALGFQFDEFFQYLTTFSIMSIKYRVDLTLKFLELLDRKWSLLL